MVEVAERRGREGGEANSYVHLIFIRHGERADQVKVAPQPTSENATLASIYESKTPHDPNLTRVGLQQASEAGKHFKKRIQEVQNENKITFDEIRVESSPFLRCLQTAANIAKELQIGSIKVNYRVCETLWDTEEFEQADANGGIFETLQLKTVDPDVLCIEALSGIEVHDTISWHSEATKLYPEDVDSLEVRYDMIAEHFKTQEAVPATTGKSLCVIVVTHAAMQMSLPERFNAREQSALGLIYASSWQALIKHNADGTRDDPVVIEELNDDYILTKSTTTPL